MPQNNSQTPVQCTPADIGIFGTITHYFFNGLPLLNFQGMGSHNPKDPMMAYNEVAVWICLGKGNRIQKWW